MAGWSKAKPYGEVVLVEDPWRCYPYVFLALSKGPKIWSPMPLGMWSVGEYWIYNYFLLTNLCYLMGLVRLRVQHNVKVQSHPYATLKIITATVLEVFTHLTSFQLQEQWEINQPHELFSTHSPWMTKSKCWWDSLSFQQGQQWYCYQRW